MWIALVTMPRVCSCYCRSADNRQLVLRLNRNVPRSGASCPDFAMFVEQAASASLGERDSAEPVQSDKLNRLRDRFRSGRVGAVRSHTRWRRDRYGRDNDQRGTGSGKMRLAYDWPVYGQDDELVLTVPLDPGHLGSGRISISGHLPGKHRRGHFAHGSVRPDRVVVGSPAVDDVACLSQAGEPMQVQAVLAELAVEAFHEGVLSRFPRLNEVQSHTASPGPEEHRL